MRTFPSCKIARLLARLFGRTKPFTTSRLIVCQLDCNDGTLQSTTSSLPNWPMNTRSVFGLQAAQLRGFVFFFYSQHLISIYYGAYSSPVGRRSTRNLLSAPWTRVTCEAPRIIDALCNGSCGASLGIKHHQACPTFSSARNLRVPTPTTNTMRLLIPLVFAMTSALLAFASPFKRGNDGSYKNGACRYPSLTQWPATECAYTCRRGPPPAGPHSQIPDGSLLSRGAQRLL